MNNTVVREFYIKVKIKYKMLRDHDVKIMQKFATWISPGCSPSQQPAGPFVVGPRAQVCGNAGVCSVWRLCVVCHAWRLRLPQRWAGPSSPVGAPCCSVSWCPSVVNKRNDCFTQTSKNTIDNIGLLLTLYKYNLRIKKTLCIQTW